MNFVARTKSIVADQMNASNSLQFDGTSSAIGDIEYSITTENMQHEDIPKEILADKMDAMENERLYRLSTELTASGDSSKRVSSEKISIPLQVRPVMTDNIAHNYQSMPVIKGSMSEILAQETADVPQVIFSAEIGSWLNDLSILKRSLNKFLNAKVWNFSFQKTCRTHFCEL